MFYLLSALEMKRLEEGGINKEGVDDRSPVRADGLPWSAEVA